MIIQSRNRFEAMAIFSYDYLTQPRNYIDADNSVRA